MRKTVLFVSALLLPFATGPSHAAHDTGAPGGLAGPGSMLERVLARMPFTGRVLCVGLPDSSVPFDTFDQDALKGWVGALRYATNPQHLSVGDGPDGHRALRQRFVPSERGSDRVVVSVNLRPARTYEVEQAVMFESGFEWGGEVESGKFGFGLAGGSAPTGGKLADDGFSARFMWKGHGDGSASVGAYLYSADRTQNLPYGDEFDVTGFTIRPGEWFRARMSLTVNSDHDAADGRIRIWIDDELLFERDGIRWQSGGALPVIDQTLYSSFHGGSTDRWSPREEVYARFSDVCVYKGRAADTGS